MTCMQCRGTMRRGAAPFHVDRKGYHLLFDAVPSWVCLQCGEVLLEEAEARVCSRRERTENEFGASRRTLPGCRRRTLNHDHPLDEDLRILTKCCYRGLKQHRPPDKTCAISIAGAPHADP